MPDKNKNPANFLGSVEQEARAHPPLSGEDIAGPATHPSAIERPKFDDWLLQATRSLFAESMPELCRKAFGEFQPTNVLFRATTDLGGLTSGPDKWLSSDEREHDPKFLLERHGSASKSRLGILVHYRPRGEPPVWRDGSPLECAPKIIALEGERKVRWGKIYEEQAFQRFRLAGQFFDLGESIEALADRVDVVFNCRPLMIVSRLNMRRPPVLELATLGDWSSIRSWLLEAFERRGGELAILLALVSESWQDRWVTPKHTPNTQPGITEPVGAPEPLAELAYPKTPPLSDLMSIRSAAAELGCDQVVLHRAIKAQKIAVYELGDGTKTVSLTECREFYANRKTTPGPEPKNHEAVEGSLPLSLETRLLRADAALQSLQSPVRAVVRQLLEEINSVPPENRSLGSLEKNQDFARSLQRLVSQAGLRLCCPSCQSPGSFVCKAGNSPDGAFAFSHGKGESKLGKRGCGGWSTIPDLKLT